MEPFVAALAGLLKVFTDPTNIVLLLVVASQQYFIFISRKETREDQGKMVDMLGRINESLGSLKNFLSAMTGKAL